MAENHSSLAEANLAIKIAYSARLGDRKPLMSLDERTGKRVYVYEIRDGKKRIVYYTRPDESAYLATREEVLTAIHRLRSVFIGGQEPGIPREWRIDGTVYKLWDDQLERALSKLDQRWKGLIFFAAQARAENKPKDFDAQMGVRSVVTKKKREYLHWANLDSEEQYWRMKQSGFEVRRVMAGRVRDDKFQFAVKHS